MGTRNRFFGLALLVGALAATLVGHAQTLTWARSDGGLFADSAEAIAVDSSGDTYVLGTFGIQASFGAGEPNATVLTSAGAVASQDIFLAKYAPDGSLLWALGIGGINPGSGGDAGTDLAGGVAVDDSGDVYITGTLFRFTTYADLGNGVVLEAPGAFVAKFDSDGNALWATAFNTTEQGQGHAVAVRTDGSVYVAGSAPEKPAVGGEVPTFWRVDANGTLLWEAQAIGGGAGGKGLAAGIGENGTVRVAGRFGGMAVFGDGQPTETTLTTASDDGFVAAYDHMGTLLWARQTESTGGAWAEGLATDSDGNSYVTGAMHGATTFGSGEAGETTLVSVAVGDAFVAKFSSAGSLVWARPVHANFNTYGMAIATDGAGSSYVTGFFGGFVTFGIGEVTETSFTGLGSSDVFVAKYETNGGFEWARRAGGASNGILDESGQGIALDASANVHVAGYFTAATTFGEGEPGETSLTSAGSTDIFVARYMEDSVPPPAGLDLDIAQFRVTNRVSVAKGSSVDLTLVVRNNSTVNGVASATVVGVQNGLVVYSHTLAVMDPPGGGRTAYQLPAFMPLVTGDITWTAIVSDQDPDSDQVQEITRVVG